LRVNCQHQSRGIFSKGLEQALHSLVDKGSNEP
jgi:hypothetical protein